MMINALSKLMQITTDQDFIQTNLNEIQTLPESYVKEIAKLINFMSNPALKSHLCANHFDNLMGYIEKEFDTLFDPFCVEIQKLEGQKKSIKTFKAKQALLESSPLVLFIKDTIGLLNRIDIELVKAGLLKLHIEQMQRHLALIDSWIQDLEEEEITANPLHKLLLSFSQKVNSLIAESHVKCGLQHYSEANADAAIGHFRAAGALGQLCLQSLKSLAKEYDLALSDEKAIAYTLLIWGHAFEGQFKLAQLYVNKLLRQLDKSPLVLTNILEPVLFYAQMSLSSDKSDVQHVIKSLTRTKHLLNTKKALYEAQSTETPEFDRTELFKTQVNALLEEAKRIYHERLTRYFSLLTVPVILEDYQLCISLANIRLAKKCAQGLLQTLGDAVQRQKTQILINDISNINTDTLLFALSQVEKLYHAKAKADVSSEQLGTPLVLQNTETSKVGKISPAEEDEVDTPAESCIVANLTTSLCNLNIELSPKAKEDTAISIAATSTIALGEVQQPIATSTPTIPSFELPVPVKAIAPAIAKENTTENHGFHAEDFVDAVFTPLNGSKGIFVAFNPNESLLSAKQSKKIPDNIDSRFCELLSVPNKAGPKNQNGFKWIVQGNTTTLVGKITRLPFRLFPIAKEVNEQGETAFLYGEIRNTKRGKRANQYSI